MRDISIFQGALKSRPRRSRARRRREKRKRAMRSHHLHPDSLSTIAADAADVPNIPLELRPACIAALLPSLCALIGTNHRRLQDDRLTSASYAPAFHHGRCWRGRPSPAPQGLGCACHCPFHRPGLAPVLLSRQTYEPVAAYNGVSHPRPGDVGARRLLQTHSRIVSSPRSFILHLPSPAHLESGFAGGESAAIRQCRARRRYSVRSRDPSSNERRRSAFTPMLARLPVPACITSTASHSILLAPPPISPSVRAPPRVPDLRPYR
ncbi:hypothetical protein DFH06DRAFT_618203 [Mycena polygramma]|nr:hypothetical protein DFH06DRAFT_618203 [Mycena polygramma]